MLTFTCVLAAASLTLLAIGDASANDLGKYKECFLKCWGRVTAQPDHCAVGCSDVIRATFNDIVLKTLKPDHEHCVKNKCFDRTILTNEERLFVCLVDGCFGNDPNSDKKDRQLELPAPRRTIGNEVELRQGKKVRRSVSAPNKSLLRRRSKPA